MQCLWALLRDCGKLCAYLMISGMYSLEMYHWSFGKTLVKNICPPYENHPEIQLSQCQNVITMFTSNHWCYRDVCVNVHTSVVSWPQQKGHWRMRRYYLWTGLLVLITVSLLCLDNHMWVWFIFLTLLPNMYHDCERVSLVLSKFIKQCHESCVALTLWTLLMWHHSFLVMRQRNNSSVISQVGMRLGHEPPPPLSHPISKGKELQEWERDALSELKIVPLLFISSCYTLYLFAEYNSNVYVICTCSIN